MGEKNADQDIGGFDLPPADRGRTEIAELELFADYLGKMLGERPVVPKLGSCIYKVPRL